MSTIVVITGAISKAWCGMTQQCLLAVSSSFPVYVTTNTRLPLSLRWTIIHAWIANRRSISLLSLTRLSIVRLLYRQRAACSIAAPLSFYYASSSRTLLGADVYFVVAAKAVTGVYFCICDEAKSPSAALAPSSLSSLLAQLSRRLEKAAM